MEQIKVCKNKQPLSKFNQGISEFYLIERIHNNEIIINEIKDSCLGYIYASDDPEIYEYYYVLEGEIVFTIDGVDHSLEKGDSILIEALESHILFKTVNPTKLMLLTNGKVFQDLTIFYDKLQGIVDEIDKKDEYTRKHCTHVSVYATIIAKELQLQQAQIEKLMIAALFHDVGKVRVPSHILKKPTKYTVEEYEIMKSHPVHTYEILKDAYSEEIALIASSHHERMDGKGYPNGLFGHEISIEARILCVADAFHAMTSKRKYQDRRDTKDAIKELMAYANTQFDPQVIQALENILIKNDFNLKKLKKEGL